MLNEIEKCKQELNEMIKLYEDRVSSRKANEIEKRNLHLLYRIADILDKIKSGDGNS